MRKLLGVCGVMTLLVCVATAQDQPRRGNRGGGGGRGGMMQQGGVTLLAIPKVQEELKLTDEQKKVTGELVEKTGAEMRGLMPDREALESLSQEERQKKFAEMGPKRQELMTKAMAEASKTLEAKQMERLEQLSLQREGINAMARPDVAGKLAITPEQKESIGKLMAEARPNFGGPGGGQNFQDMSEEERRAALEKRRESQEKLKTDVLGVLTAEQKTTFEKMQGEKFEFPMGGFGRGGGGGGGEKKRPASKKDNAT